MTRESNEPVFRVLVVEDQQRYRDLLTREIAAMGFAADGVQSAEQAWQLLQDQEYQVVLLDLQLPGMHGMELFDKVRQAMPGSSVVILTAYGDMDAAVQALRWQAADFLSKPCSLSDIERVLCRLYQRWCVRRHSDHTPVVSDPVAVEDIPQHNAGRAKPQTLEDLERDHILSVLQANDGNKPAAAAQLGISLRTLYNKLNAYRES